MCENEQENDYVLAFDHFYTNNHIQIIKALLPFLDSEAIPYLPAIIKYLELKYTLGLIRTKQQPLTQINSAEHHTNNSVKPEQIYNAIKKYLAPNEDNTFKNILNTLNTISSVKEMQEMMEMFQSLNNTDGSNSTLNGMPDISSISSLFGDNININDMMQLFSNINQ